MTLENEGNCSSHDSGIAEEANAIQMRLTEARLKGEATLVEVVKGRGAVKVVVNGKGEIESLTLSDELLQRSEGRVLEAYIRDAVNDAVRESKRKMTEELHQAAQGIRVQRL